MVPHEPANEPVRRRRKTLNDNMISKLKREPQRYSLADPEARHVYLRIPPEGPVTFYAVCRDAWGKQTWVKLGDTSTMGIVQARDLARTVVARLREGKPAFEPVPPKPESFQAVAEEWFKRVVVAEKHRSGDEVLRCLRAYVYPAWADRDFLSIRRSDIVKLRDAISDNNGVQQSAAVFSIIARICAWFAIRNDDYASPIIKGLRPRLNGSRDRILDDAELVRVWRAAEASGIFGAFVQLALLTAQRRSVLLNMKWDDINGNTWTIPLAEREKKNAGVLELPPQAMKILERLPRFKGNPYVFAGRDGNPIMGIAAPKAKLDEVAVVSGWTIHDLRRTARSLLSRARIGRDIAERALGHTVGTAIEQTYDRHDYHTEMAHALRALASLIATIVNPPDDNVIPMAHVKKKARGGKRL
jgi:integrase